MLAKLSIPMVALPVVAVVVTLATQLVVLVVGSMVLASNGLSASLIANPDALGHIVVSLFYGAVVLSLWYAPIYGWLLLVSSWAQAGAVPLGHPAAARHRRGRGHRLPHPRHDEPHRHAPRRRLCGGLFHEFER